MMFLKGDIERERHRRQITQLRALLNIPLDLILRQPFLARRIPVLVSFEMLVLVVILPVFDAVVVSRPAGLHHGFHTADDGAADDGGPGVDGLEDGVGGGGDGGEEGLVFAFEAGVQVFGGAEAANEEDRLFDISISTPPHPTIRKAIWKTTHRNLLPQIHHRRNLPINKLNNLLHNRLKNRLHLLSRHAHKPTINPHGLIIRQSRKLDREHILVFPINEYPLDILLPGFHGGEFGLFFHGVVDCRAETLLHEAVETLVEHGAAAELAGAWDGLFDAEGGGLGYFVGD